MSARGNHPGAGAEEYPPLTRVTLDLCDQCIDGVGGWCHTPGCNLFLNRAPDISLRFWVNYHASMGRGA